MCKSDVAEGDFLLGRETVCREEGVPGCAGVAEAKPRRGYIRRDPETNLVRVPLIAPNEIVQQPEGRRRLMSLKEIAITVYLGVDRVIDTLCCLNIENAAVRLDRATKASRT